MRFQIMVAELDEIIGPGGRAFKDDFSLAALGGIKYSSIVVKARDRESALDFVLAHYKTCFRFPTIQVRAITPLM